MIKGTLLPVVLVTARTVLLRTARHGPNSHLSARSRWHLIPKVIFSPLEIRSLVLEETSSDPPITVIHGKTLINLVQTPLRSVPTDIYTSEQITTAYIAQLITVIHGRIFRISLQIRMSPLLLSVHRILFLPRQIISAHTDQQIMG